MQVLTTFLYILLFLVFLSILIIIHELGHLAAAKAFNVYCLEYSIGMGPLLFKHKRKNGETQFSIRGIPFGGYVSMYGEGVPLPEGVTVDESRSLNNAKPWKRAIILSAGVIMNAVLALVFFFISNCFPHTEYDQFINRVNVSETSSIASLLEDGSYIKFETFEYTDTSSNNTSVYFLIDRETTFDDDNTTKYATCLYIPNGTKELDLSKHINFFELKEETVDGVTKIVPDFSKYVYVTSFATATIHLTERVPVGGGESVDGDVIPLTINQVDGEVQSFGLSIWSKHVQYNFGQIVTHTFQDFGNGSVAIVRALGDLFTKPSAWNDVGGIIAIGFQTTSVLKTYGFIYFLRVWAIISVNLAIFNLLPFPGLDGWQLLVLGIETGTRKKIPEKVKNIVSMVGIGLLLALMLVVVFKDLFTYVFVGGLFL